MLLSDIQFNAAPPYPVLTIEQPPEPEREPVLKLFKKSPPETFPVSKTGCNDCGGKNKPAFSVTGSGSNKNILETKSQPIPEPDKKPLWKLPGDTQPIQAGAGKWLIIAAAAFVLINLLNQ